jgi:hypothetical protein
MAQLVIPTFGGGVVLAGSTDAKKTDELAACDAFDLGDRGQITAASDLSGTETGLTANYGAAGSNGDWPLLVVGASGGTLKANAFTATLVSYLFPYDFEGTPAVPTSGLIVTSAGFPYVASASTLSNPVFINLGARSNNAPNVAAGLYVWTGNYPPPAGSEQPVVVSRFDALGTGNVATSSASFAGGTNGKQLYFRGIAAYNNHLFGYGFDNADTNKEGRNRLMFSNTGNPYKWGNDNLGAAGDRAFTDSDAITIGAAGDRITCAYAWSGKLWIATDRELHWLAGYGRESFITDGSNVQARENVIGPNAMREGPDGLLYGVGSRGLWAFDGGTPELVGRALVNFAGKSPGWWDLIWTDSTRAAGYPGTTNQDLVWMVSVRERQQVWVVIPYCNATLGYGVGADTVVIKYHTQTGGFTRQVFASQTLTAGMVIPRSASASESAVIVGHGLVRQYGARTTLASVPVLPTTLPSATFGPYAPYGPHGTGVHRVVYTTLAWEAASSLPLVFTVTPSVDDQTLSAIKVSIQSTTPATPADGDYWLDTSGTDTGTVADYAWKTYSASRTSWVTLPHGGQKGTRATLRLAHTATRGARVSYAFTTTTATGRFQIESLGLQPAAGREGA